MSSTAESAVGTAAPFDDLADALQELRVDAGRVSYAEIAARITERRVADGDSPAAARVARSTVYDAFQRGRRRLNADLVREIVLALGHDATAGDAWRRRCLDAHRAALPSRDGTEPDEVAQTAPPSTDAMTVTAGDSVDAPEPTPAWRRDEQRMIRTGFTIAALAACVGLNLFGSAIININGIPLWFDMIGTAVAAFAIGPWQAVAIALITHVLNVPLSSPPAAVFVIVNVGGALCWGYGIRWAKRSALRFASVLVGTALMCAMLGAVITLFLFHGSTGHASDATVAALAPSLGAWPAQLLVNACTSLADKIPTGLIALIFGRLIVRAARAAGSSDPAPLLVPRSRR